MSETEEITITVNKPKRVIIKREKKIIKTTKNEKEKKLEEIKKRQQRENILKSIRDKQEYLELEGKQFIYPNQQEAADKCIDAFKNGAVAVCLIAQPGTGKTGTAQAVMIHMATNPNDDEIIYSENIINCTGMSDNDWETQFKNSVLPPFKDNIFHRQNLIKQKDKLQTLKDALLIPDECHIASGIKMTIAKTLKEAGILDVNVLEMRNIKMLDISATPDAVLNDYKKWGTKCAIIKIQPGPSYKGFDIMLKENRILDAPNLEELDDYYELLEFLDERYKNTTKKYFIFRLLDPVKTTILENVCNELGWDFLNHNSDERIDEIDNLMKNPPQKHTLIFVKGFWRASKRISRQHIGATYEQIPKKRDVSVTAQSLAARDCDNYEYSGDQQDVNLRPLHYCDKGAIEQYVDWFNNDCDFSSSEYKSSRINSNGKGSVNSKKSKVNPENVSGIDDDSDSNIDDECLTVPIVIPITEEQFKCIRPKRWNFDKLFEYMGLELRTELKRISEKPVDHECPDPTKPGYKKKIITYIKAENEKKKLKAWATEITNNPTKDNYVIYLDQKEYRIIVSIYYGSKSKK
jgi:hypothetical protein